MAESQRTSHGIGRGGRRLRAGVRWAHAARLPGVLAVLLGCLWIVTAGGAQASLSGTAAGRGWKVERTPDQNRDAAGINELSAVSCGSGRACTAAGSHAAGLSGTGFPLAERWNGTRWRIQPVMLPAGATSGGLAGVSCPSASACTAVGSTPGQAADTSVNLAERWNGTRWRVQRTPAPANSGGSQQEPELNAVSCASATACTASGGHAPGGHSAYFLEAWNGHGWRLVTAPYPAGFLSGTLNGASCVPARCTAAGAWSGGPVFTATLAMAN